MRIISFRVLITTLKFSAGVGPSEISEAGSYPVRTKTIANYNYSVQDNHDIRDVYVLRNRKPVRP